MFYFAHMISLLASAMSASQRSDTEWQGGRSVSLCHVNVSIVIYFG